jgi:AraC family transcriptional activator of mtrCDE
MTKPEFEDALSGLAPLLRVRPELTELCRFGGAWASPHAAEPAGWAFFPYGHQGPRRAFLRKYGVRPGQLRRPDGATAAEAET